MRPLITRFIAFWFFFWVCLPAQAESPKIEEISQISENMASHLDDVKENRETYIRDFEKFENGPVAVFFQYTSPRRTLLEIIGEDRFTGLTAGEQNALVLEMRETYRRYLYEWLLGGNDIEISALELNKMKAKKQFEAENIVEVKLKSSISILPDITVTAYIAAIDGQWRAFDFSFWGLRYSSGKRGSFRRRFDGGGVMGLIEYMSAKNDTFFDGLLRVQ
jgi:ABC-type transporter MlaC component